MATEVDTVIDTDGTGDYPSHNAAEADNYGASNASLVAANEWCNCRCRATGGTRDTVTVWVNGQTCDGTHYIKVWTDPADTGGDGVGHSYRHLGTIPTAGQKIYCHNPAGTAITISTPFTQVIGLAITFAPGGDYWKGVYTVAISTVALNVIEMTGNAAPYNGPYLIACDGAAGATKIYGNILRDANGPLCIAVYISSTAASSNIYIYANTIDNCRNGVKRLEVDGAVFVTDNVLFGCTDCFDGAFANGSTHNFYTEGADPGADGVDISGYTGAQLFKDYTGNDFTPLAGGPLVNTGYDISTDAACPVAADYAGTVRPQGLGFDGGAIEYKPPPNPLSVYRVDMTEAEAWMREGLLPRRRRRPRRRR